MSDPADQAAPRPAVTIIIANYNGAAYLSSAIRSAQLQTLRDLEIIVSDDGSTDNSIAIVGELMHEDPRIRLVRSTSNRGPAAARNHALAHANGEWIAVMDSDDLMHPERLNQLIEAGNRDGADFVADNLLEFYEDNSAPPRPLLVGRWELRPRWVDLVEFIELNLFYARGPNLGYLKPLFHSSLLTGPFRYDETLTIGEDYDLVARLLQAGKKLRVYPDTWYFYRKHGASLSRRPSKNAIKALEAIKAAHHRFESEAATGDRRLAAALNTRRRSIDTALLFQKLINSMKAGQWRESLRIAFRRPRVAALLRIPIGTRLRRLMP